MTYATTSLTLPAGANLSPYPNAVTRPGDGTALPTAPLSAPAIAPVPEPASLGLLSLGALLP